MAEPRQLRPTDQHLYMLGLFMNIDSGVKASIKTLKSGVPLDEDEIDILQAKLQKAMELAQVGKLKFGDGIE